MFFFKVYVHGCAFTYLFILKEKNLILRVGRPLEKVIAIFIYFKIFKGCQS